MIKKILLWLLENNYKNDLIKWKLDQIKKDEEVAHYKNYFSSIDYESNKICRCNRPINQCRCLDKAFGM